MADIWGSCRLAATELRLDAFQSGKGHRGAPCDELVCSHGRTTPAPAFQVTIRDKAPTALSDTCLSLEELGGGIGTAIISTHIQPKKYCHRQTKARAANVIYIRRNRDKCEPSAVWDCSHAISIHKWSGGSHG
eukprot:scaffold252315_cov19-Prasinocladus_malaysianus.AAC.1